jgi:hypothetical protein
MLSAKHTADRMTLEELGKTLDEMKPGNFAAIHHDLFADLFPPGEPDDHAREACNTFARQHGCRIENKRGQSELWFVKDA